MSKEKLIEEMAEVLRHSCDGECFKDKKGHPDCEVCEARLLYEAGYRKSEWISVDERLPGVSGKYICCVKDKRGNTWTVPADWSLEMKMWFGEFGEIKNMVTHWMPLPEAPKMKGGAE